MNNIIVIIITKILVRVAGFEPDTIGVRSQRNFHAALGSTRLKRFEVRIELTLSQP
jgi:hypothetical protein